MSEVIFSEIVDELLAQEPAASPPAVSAWMARQLSDKMIEALRCMGRAQAQGVMYEIADDLEAFAQLAEQKAA